MALRQYLHRGPFPPLSPESGSRTRCHLLLWLLTLCAHMPIPWSCLRSLFEDKQSQLGSEAAKPGPAASGSVSPPTWSFCPFVNSTCPPCPQAHRSSWSWHAGPILSLSSSPCPRGLLGWLCKLSSFLPPSSPFILHRKSLSISVAITEYYRLVGLLGKKKKKKKFILIVLGVEKPKSLVLEPGDGSYNVTQQKGEGKVSL